MADIKKSAQAAALEATGLAGKIDELRQEFNATIDRCEDRLRGDIRDVRKDMRGVREDMRGMHGAMAALRREASNDRQQMLAMLSVLISRGAPLEVRDRGTEPDP